MSRRIRVATPDVVWWHRPLRDRPASPDPPSPAPVVRESAAFEAALRAPEDVLEA
jgi:hypothetical protein